MAERKPGFIYIYSETLKQEVAWSKKTGIVYCQDGVKYSPAELDIIGEDGGELPLGVHIIKKVFTGSEVVRYEPRTGTTDKGKRDEKQNKENRADVSNSGGAVPGTSGSGAGSQDGYFDIY
jgi:hypothetical protein